MDVFVVMVGEGVGNMQCGTGSAQRESLSLLLLLLLVLLGVRVGVWVGCRDWFILSVNESWFR